VNGGLSPGQHQDIDLAAFPLNGGVEAEQNVGQARVSAHVRPAGSEAGGAVQVAVLGDVDQQHARMLGLEITQPVGVAHRNGQHVIGRIRNDLAGRRTPLLEVLPEGVVLVVETDYLPMTSLAVPS
jgi:hypothetical protein